MAIDKQANIKLENNAYYQELTKTNIDFYNRDFNTSVLNFVMTRNSKPMLLGKENVETNITLKFEDGSLIRDDLRIKDSMNGILTYTLSTKMLQHTGKVIGQVEVAVKGKEDTVVQRLFSFNISNSLIESIDAETKLTYIKRFADLESDILERYERMETSFAEGEKLAQAVVDAANKGLTDIDSAKTISLTDIENAKSNGVLEIQTLSDGTITNINTHITEIEEKIKQFNSDVASKNYIAMSDTSTWQKYKLTKDNGDVTDLPTGSDLSSTTFLNTLKAGHYYVPAPKGGPDGSASGFIDVVSRTSGALKIATYRPYNKDKIYINRFYNTWSGWHDITGNMETITGSQVKANQALEEAKAYIDENIYDTGWQDLPLMSGVNADEDAGPSKYRIKNGICTIIFNLRMAVAQSETPFITLPQEVLPQYSFSFLARTNGDVGKNPVDCNYDSETKQFKIWQNNDNTINTGDFVYGYITYIVGGLDV